MLPWPIHLQKNPPIPRIYITKGVAGSGKSSVAGQLVEKIGAIRVRSDVERKRLFRLSSGEADKMYSDETTIRVYNRLLKISESVIENGYSVVVDATFLKKAQRVLFADLAKNLGANFFILDMSVDPTLAGSRIKQRLKDGNDPSDAGIDVMKMQFESMEPLTQEEKKVAVTIDGGDQESIEHSCETILRQKAYPAV